MESLAGVVARPFTRRFGIVTFLPSITLSGFLVLLLLSGAPGSAPSLGVLLQRLESMTFRQFMLLVALTLIAALVLHPLQFPLIQLLEGYWGTGRVSRVLWRIASARQQTRQARVASAVEQRDRDHYQPSDPRDWAGREAARLQRSMPEPDQVMPTRLGATLKAYEDRAGDRYGFAAVLVILRIYALMDPVQRHVYDDFRNQLDTGASFTAVWLISTAAATLLLIWHGWWIAVAFVTLALAWASYRAAIAAAQGFGEILEASIDLYRFDVYRALHLPEPESLEDELRRNEDLDLLLMGYASPEIEYRHADTQST